MYILIYLSNFLCTQSDIINTISTLLTAVGTILVPLIIFFFGIKYEMRKKQEEKEKEEKKERKQKQKEDLVMLKEFIDSNIEPLLRTNRENNKVASEGRNFIRSIMNEFITLSNLGMNTEFKTKLLYIYTLMDKLLHQYGSYSLYNREADSGILYDIIYIAESIYPIILSDELYSYKVKYVEEMLVIREPQNPNNPQS